MTLTNPIIYNSDIVAIEKKAKKTCLTPEEADLLKFGKNCNETKIQSFCNQAFRNLAVQVIVKKLGDMVFFQIDNGGKLKDGGRIRKWQEGALSGMTDSAMLLFNRKSGKNKTIFCEFKRIGCESEIKGNPATKSGLKIYQHFKKQQELHERLRNMGFEVVLTNNPVYFEKVFLERVWKFFE
jgi:hypothetical protein